ncbi:EAL domain-containing protein [Novosphingobium sp. H3SJ31-1]|uniref:EAL domain-containing protein n=2 Tax=Novosphingobium album (ex Liu et al. 2023) TaxID=3031130 RepID=A0ABT5WPM6_9SPHN|nr:EAL domain-containing protein [Novosphingobium album (ex Liu et al. 2023)]MDE8651237.1 EAL domain-containing protein [Novosphingobium album (ex Liu et al. 2023)]
MAPARTHVSDPLHFFVAPEWALMAPCLVAALAVMGLVSFSLPSLVSASIALGGIVITAGSRIAARFEASLDPASWLRYPLMLAMVFLPMFLFGLTASRWTWRVDSVTWEMTVAVLGVVGLIATALLNGRLTSIIAANVGLWVGASIYGGSMVSMALLLTAGAIGLFLAYSHALQAAREGVRRADREREQRRAEELLAEYEQTGQGWFWETDRRGQISYVSPRIARLLGKTQDELEGRPFIELFVLDAREQESERTLVFHLSTRSSFQDLAVQAATGEQEERWWSITGRPVLDQFNNFLGFRGSGTDLTETRKSQRHVTELARFDSLTKLANRFQMAEWLDKILNAPRVENRACAVFLLDLDRFKQVNDTMGHPAGDVLLKQVADRLRTTVGNAGRVGRLGGDEFQIILPGHAPRESLANLARRIIETLSHPYSIEGSRVTIGASVGIALCPDDGTTSEEIIRNADLALYAAKDGGRGRHHFYAKDLHSEAQERQQLEQDLRDAIAHGELELHYQPQVRTTTEKITGFEALLRWKHPRDGYLSPAKFVPIAEDAGLIAAIGEWALRTACHDLARWPEEVRVAVNVSPLQFANPALPAIVTNAIAAAGISPARLELEITESVFLNDDQSTEAMFAALKRVGVRLALDDFGTGYSSLGYLKKAPFDKIKIDQSFVRGATVEGSRNGAIIASIVSLAEALGMETTAEGVETLDELDLVRMLGCSHIQGYIYEKALNADAATIRMHSGLTAIAKGPRSARAQRQTMLRKVMLQHGSHRYDGTIRNISQTGAMIEGLWNVPPGTPFGVQLGDDYVVEAVARWCKEDRMGVEFARPLDLDAAGAVAFVPPRGRRDRPDAPLLRQTG